MYGAPAPFPTLPPPLVVAPRANDQIFSEMNPLSQREKTKQNRKPFLIVRCGERLDLGCRRERRPELGGTGREGRDARQPPARSSERCGT